MIAKTITYERLKSTGYNHEKIGIVVEVQDGEKAADVLEKAKIFVKKQLDEIPEEDIPF